MAGVPRRVNDRKIALIRELGYDADMVPEGGFDSDGFDVVQVDLDGKNLVIGDRVATKRVMWPNIEWSRRASEAMGKDFAESFAVEPGGALAAIWDAGFDAHRLELERQAKDPSYPIHRPNPYRGS